MPLPFSATIPGVPAVASRTIAHGWLRSLIVHANTGPDSKSSEDTLDIEVCGYLPETGEIVHGASQRVRMPLWAAVQSVPEVAAAMEAVLAAVPALEAYAAEREK